jgi:hypothetical protein
MVPILYVTFQRLHERMKGTSKSNNRLTPPVDETV